MKSKIGVATILILVTAPAGRLMAQGTAPAPRTISVNMTQTGPTTFAYQPAQITAHPGDTLRFVQVGAMPHNVQFTRVPADAALGAAMMGPFLTVPNQTYTLVVDGRFAIGSYHFVCTPHEAMGMTGTLAVTSAGPVTSSSLR